MKFGLILTLSLFQDLKVSTKTQSLWIKMNSQLANYRNPFYKVFLHSKILINRFPIQNDISFLTDVDIRPQNFIVWSALYNRFDSGIQPREYFSDTALAIHDHIQFLEDSIEEKLNGNLEVGSTN